jgi:hypothetical protein
MCCCPADHHPHRATLNNHGQSVSAAVMAAALFTKHTTDSPYECKWTGPDISESSMFRLRPTNADGNIYIKLYHYHSAADHDDNSKSPEQCMYTCISAACISKPPVHRPAPKLAVSAAGCHATATGKTTIYGAPTAASTSTSTSTGTCASTTTDAATISIAAASCPVIFPATLYRSRPSTTSAAADDTVSTTTSIFSAVIDGSSTTSHN